MSNLGTIFHVWRKRLDLSWSIKDPTSKMPTCPTCQLASFTLFSFRESVHLFDTQQPNIFTQGTDFLLFSEPEPSIFLHINNKLWIIEIFKKSLKYYDPRPLLILLYIIITAHQLDFISPKQTKFSFYLLSSSFI